MDQVYAEILLAKQLTIIGNRRESPLASRTDYLLTILHNLIIECRTITSSKLLSTHA